MIGARKAVRRAFGLMVPRTSRKMRQNEVYRWTNRLVWLAIVLIGLVAAVFNVPGKS
ncbi:hypothetical protein ALISP_2321 [Alicycliphilus sp. B1]|nr:hypothetical protein ALISP_2321 [Alicycliphilus sp. B1]